MIERKDYLKQLETWRNKDMIKVITGIRRSGKSTLLKLYQEQLMREGIQSSQIISINFEDMDFNELLDDKKLYQYIKERLLDNKDMYIFLDEIQRVHHYENVVDSLFIKDHIDIYMTGSSSYLFSGELATHLSGRYIEIQMYPLSFKEYYPLSHKSKIEAFHEYMDRGGFPYLTNFTDLQNEIYKYTEAIFTTIVYKDIRDRFRRMKKSSHNGIVHDIALLESITKYLSSVIGSQVSVRNITNYLISNHRNVSPNTVSDYMNALCEAYVFYPVDQIDIVGKEILKANKKYYIVDLGLRNYILPQRRYDLGFSLENIVYFDLKRRGYEVYIGKGTQNNEVDFIVKKNNIYSYYQVTASMIDEKIIPYLTSLIHEE